MFFSFHAVKQKRIIPSKSFTEKENSMINIGSSNPSWNPGSVE
jgi:hypothetical protein